jgi:hypothetical protein
MKRLGFKMRSGNSPLAFKLMGSSPVKQTKEDNGEGTEKNETKVTSNNNKDNTSNNYKAKKPTQKELIGQADKQFGDGVQVSGGNKTVEKEVAATGKSGGKKTGKKEPIVEMPNLPVEKLKVDSQTDPEPRPANSGQAYSDKEVMSDDYNYPTSDNSGDQSEKGKKKPGNPEKDGWKFDIDWNEVGTEAIKTGVRMGIAALSAGTKKPPRRSGSIRPFAAHKFGTNTDITKS